MRVHSQSPSQASQVDTYQAHYELSNKPESYQPTAVLQLHLPSNPNTGLGLPLMEPTLQLLSPVQGLTQPTTYQVIDSTDVLSSERLISVLLPNLPSQTPVCIGQLNADAFILYPIDLLDPGSEQSVGSEEEWTVVSLVYEQNHPKGSGRDLIHIRTPTSRGASNETLGGDTFGMIELEVVDIVGPLLGKRVVRVEARIRKGFPNVSSGRWFFIFAR